jgi:SAM-dependent methyltransferase
VLDRHKPQNSLKDLPFIDTRAVPLGQQKLEADVLFLCVSPGHNATLQREAETLQGAPLVCAMYKDEERKESAAHSSFSERFVEYAFVFECLSQLYPQRVLDVGTGATALPSLVAVGGSEVTAIDHFAPLLANPSFYVWCHDIQRKRFDDPFDMILCISTLEHVFEYEDALENMVASLKPGGHLVLTMPVTEGAYVENLFRVPGNFYFDPQSTGLVRLFSLDMIQGWLAKHNLREVRRKCYSQFQGANVGDGEQRRHPVPCDNGEPIHLICLLLRREEA